VRKSYWILDWLRRRIHIDWNLTTGGHCGDYRLRCPWLSSESIDAFLKMPKKIRYTIRRQETQNPLSPADHTFVLSRGEFYFLEIHLDPGTDPMIN
jgi:hypothetical protein